LAVDLSEGVTRNFINDLQGLRNFVVGKPLANKGQNLVEVYALRAIHQLHEAGHALTKIRIRHTDHGGFMDRRMGHQDAFDFHRGDIRTAANN
jgi:hypothetical protein